MNCSGLNHLFLYYLYPSALDPVCVTHLSDRSLDGIFGLPGPTYVLYFAATCLLEFPVYRAFLKRDIALPRLIGWVIALNLLTHPSVSVLIPQFMAMEGFSKAEHLLVGELFAPLVEGFTLWTLAGISVRKALLSAAAANLFSWGFGSLLAQTFRSV